MRTTVAFWLFAVAALAGDPRHTIEHPGLLANLRTQPTSDWLICGDDHVRLESSRFAEQFFLGPKKIGVAIRGLSGQKLWEQGRTLSATELNSALDAAAKDSRLVFVTEGRVAPKVSAAPSATRIQIPETRADCLARGPKSFQCGAGVSRESCCEEGPAKLYGFDVTWPDPERANVTWRLRYHPGYGNTTLVAKDAREPVRYCITDGITLLPASR